MSVVNNFNSNLQTHLKEKSSYLNLSKKVISTGVHVVVDRSKELARFKSREDRNKGTSNWSFSIEEKEDLAQLQNLGYKIWIILTENGRMIKWKEISSRLDPNRAGQNKFMCITL